jgi:hypothetical protein
MKSGFDLFENPVCTHHCSVCEGQDHHWLPDCDDESGEPIMICKHCEARREIRDDDDELV